MSGFIRVTTTATERHCGHERPALAPLDTILSVGCDTEGAFIRFEKWQWRTIETLDEIHALIREEIDRASIKLVQVNDDTEVDEPEPMGLQTINPKKKCI